MDGKTRDLMAGLSVLVLISFFASLVIHPVAILKNGEALWSKWSSRAHWSRPQSEAQKIEIPESMPVDPGSAAPDTMIPRKADDLLDGHVAPGAKAIALGPQMWITSDDYPVEALRMNWQGTVAIGWTVSIDGRARNCRVLKSSGYAVLDEAACNAILKRARYSVVYDRNGRATSSEDHRRVVWRLPD